MEIASDITRRENFILPPKISHCTAKRGPSSQMPCMCRAKSRVVSRPINRRPYNGFQVYDWRVNRDLGSLRSEFQQSRECASSRLTHLYYTFRCASLRIFLGRSVGNLSHRG
jgi:hypothetical protein